MNISILHILGIAFIILKLTNVINWSWWLVTLPLWIGLVIALILYVVAQTWAFVYGLYLKKAKPKEYAAMQERIAKRKAEEEWKKRPLSERLQQLKERQEELTKNRK